MRAGTRPAPLDREGAAPHCLGRESRGSLWELVGARRHSLRSCRRVLCLHASGRIRGVACVLQICFLLKDQKGAASKAPGGRLIQPSHINASGRKAGGNARRCAAGSRACITGWRPSAHQPAHFSRSKSCQWHDTHHHCHVSSSCSARQASAAAQKRRCASSASSGVRPACLSGCQRKHARRYAAPAAARSAPGGAPSAARCFRRAAS